MGVGVCWSGGRADTSPLLQAEDAHSSPQQPLDLQISLESEQKSIVGESMSWRETGAEWSVREPRPLQSADCGEEVTCADMRDRELALGGGSGDLQLWRWTAGRGFERAARRRAGRGAVLAVRYDASGVWIAAAVAGGVRVFLTSRPETTRWLPGAGGAAGGAAGAGSLCWAAGGFLAAAGGAGCELCVWRVSTGRLLRRARGEGGLTECCGGKLLLTSAEGALLLYDLRDIIRPTDDDGEASPRLREENAHDLGVLCIDSDRSADTGDTSLLATGGHDGRIRLWRAHRTGPRLVSLCALDGHSSAVTEVRWLPDGSLASAALDRAVRLWGARGGTQLPAQPRPSTALAASGALLVSGFSDGVVRAWSLGEFDLDSSFDSPCSILSHFGVGDLEVRFGTRLFDSASVRRQLQRRALQGIEPDSEASEDAVEETQWDGGEECEASGARRSWRERLGGRGAAINCVARRGALLAVASSDGVVRVYACEGSGLRPLLEMRAHKYPVTSVDFYEREDGAVLLVSAALDGRLVLWDLATGEAVRTLSAAGGSRGAGGGGIRAVRTAAGMALAGGDDHVALLWDLRDPSPEPCHVFGEGHEDAVLCVCWADGDAGVALAGGAGGELSVFDTAARTLLLKRDAVHELGVQSCDSSSRREDDGARVVSGGGDSLVKLWRLRLEPRALLVASRTLRGHGGMLTCCRLSAEGGRVVTAATDMHVRVWSWSSGSCLSVVSLSAGVGAACLWAEDGRGRLAVATLAGELSLWEISARLMEGTGAEAECGSERGGVEAAADGAVLWGANGIAAWLLELCLKNAALADSKDALVSRVAESGMNGERLIEAPIGEVMADFGYVMEDIERDAPTTSRPSEEDPREALLEELRWLRDWPRLRNTADKYKDRFPHGLLCGITHRPLLDAASASDGFTYDRAALAAHLTAALRSPLTARVVNATLTPNRAATVATRSLLRKIHEETEGVMKRV